MKKFMIVFFAVVVALFVGIVVYVGVSKDFEEPLKADENVVPPEDNEIWSKSLEDLAEYLYSEGLIENTDIGDFADCGIASRWVGIGEGDGAKGIGVVFWDLQNLETTSSVYEKYKTAVEQGILDGGTAFTAPCTVHGPFAITDVDDGYKFDVNELYDKFNNWCMDK